MLLWDVRFSGARQTLAALHPQRRFDLAVAAIDRAVAQFDPPLGDGPETRLVNECLAQLRLATAQPTGVSLAGETGRAIEAVLTDGAEWGIVPVLMAFLCCCDHADRGLPADSLYDVLSHCYQAMLEREDPEPETLEEELASPHCVATIDWQLRRIADALLATGATRVAAPELEDRAEPEYESSDPRPRTPARLGALADVNDQSRQNSLPSTSCITRQDSL